MTGTTNSVSYQCRYIDEEYPPSSWTYCTEEAYDIYRTKEDYEVRIVYISGQLAIPCYLPLRPFQTIDRVSDTYKAGWNACISAMLEAAQQGDSSK